MLRAGFGVTSLFLRVLGGSALILGGLAATPAPVPPKPAAATPAGFAQVYQLVKPSVVYIVAALPNGAASGSGFIYASTGSTSTIVTANHVVEGASRVDVILDSDVHQRFPATVTRRDHVRDVAILTINVGNRRALALMDRAKIQEGADVAVVGYPRATSSFEKLFADDLRPSVHVGIVSAIRLNGEVVQFDAATDHGDSGGPVIDKATGAVIAIVRGVLLDPSYAARGIEAALPGSQYGMSVATISQVLEGAPAAASVAAAGMARSMRTTDSDQAATVSATNGNAVVASAGSAGPRGSSAAFRVGYGTPHFTNLNVESISQSVLTRLANAFTNESAFYMVPVKFGIVRQPGEALSGICDESRLNAIVQPAVIWRSPLVYASGAPAQIEATVSLVVTDCGGDPVFVVQKRKSEDTRVAHHGTAQEIIDMSNDLLDQTLRDFETFRSTHTAAWNSLLQTGIYADPTDNKYYPMVVLSKPKDATQVRVYSLYPGGPGARAGLIIGDVIESINGKPTEGMTPVEAAELFNTASATLVVRRPGGEATLTMTPQKYGDLLASLGR